MSELKYAEAVRAALAAEMAADPAVVLLGEEIGPLGGVFTTTLGLQDQFGPDRVIDMPISEAALVGWAIGAATQGLRPVVEIMFMDFVTCAMDQVVNSAAKLRYMSGGQLSVPLVLRMPADAGTHHGPQHSQHLESWFAHVPGLVVAMPSNANDAFWMLRQAIRSDDPVVFVESKFLYFRDSAEIETGIEPPDLRQHHARRSRTGDRLTVVSAGRMVRRVEEVADNLAADGIRIDVIDLRYLYPLDVDTVLESVTTTGKLAVVTEAVSFCGWGAEIASQVAERRLYDLDAPILRLGAARAPVPFEAGLEDEVIPTTARIERALRDLAVV